ncbi:PREDICTED: protein ENHANCED DOWNY MILDEW 2-like [Camelina sativa]|uniref:Protein ENHANCED DOWNY MILDEW 2-like n=2 Tax=Camelina sativa TaxID=90675 RepID=A0ABM1QZ86_CAMSA|nr:PREDICTED: protein ENHANCED DOWNY MILDEW 2-like [Camelina sativa]
MAFVDDDEEEDYSVPQSASNYYFEDDDKEPVSFARLPIQWTGEDKVVDGSALGLYLRGRSGDGLLPLHKLVKAWRFDLSNFRPEVSVLTKDNIWVKLEEPRKSYAELIRTVLVTLYSIQFFRRNPQASEKSLLEKLSRCLRSYDVKPSQNDLVDHIDLIAEAAKRDVNLAESKFILAFLAKKPTKRRLADEDNAKDDFIVGDDDNYVASDEDESGDEDDDFFESVCAICDNGGEILCCEGSCLRSFHATKKDGEDSLCDSLGFTKMQVEAIQKYFCPNCEHKIHQCFICKNLGSSDNSAGAAEVFQCVSATCGYFYHPRCVTRRLRLGNKEESEALERQIIAGEFTCPLHKCSVCENGEVKTDSNLQFAVCRRCPKSYHRKCLPREISFEDIEDEDIFTRAWDGLLHNRVLIYCQEHEIDEELLTPVRDHVKFPFTEEKKAFIKEKKKILESHVGRDRERPKVKDPALQDTCRKASVKSCRSSFPSSKDGVSTKKQRLVLSVPDHLRKRKDVDPSIKYKVVPQKSQKMMEDPREAGKNKLGVKEAREVGKSKVSLGERLFNYVQEPNIVKPGRVDPVDSKHHKTDSIASKEPGSEIHALDNDSQRRLLAVMKRATEEITMGTILKKFKVQSMHTNSTRNVVDKTITMGKVEGSVQAVRTALKKLEEGGNIEDAKAVCEPEVLRQISKWKDKLKVYLAPFIHGARYTSFGRHFTNPEKLQQIVDRLHWYAEDGDMIVDFCCGANDFSCLMKTKLEETGKKCLYKNYDLIQSKNTFNFERKDWMTVRKDDLEPGSKLIMGLNPPFGVNASLANKFIAKALEFRPKILILIVPPETERLDKKKSSYVLIWEDKTFLSGNSFYLPGSVNEEDKQLEDWNNVPPPLSLWSRSDFAAKHKKIAEKHCHLFRDVGSSNLGKVEEEANGSLHPLGAFVGMCTTIPRDSPSTLDNEDVPMEQDEIEVAECVTNILLSEKIETREAIARVHQSDHLSKRSQLEKEEKTKDCSGRKLGKSVDANDVDLKSNDMEEDRADLNRAQESIKVKIPEMSSDWQSPVRASPDDIYDVCTSISNTTSQRPHETVEVSLPTITRTKSNLGKNIREPDGKVQGIGKPEVTLNRPSSVRSSREDIYTVRPSPANTGQKPFEAFEPSHGATLSHFDDGLAAKYGLGGGYRMPDPHFIPDQFDFRGYSDLSRGVSPREYSQQYVGHLDPMLAPPPPNLMDNTYLLQQRYAPHFDQMNYQRMSSFPSQPPMQPSGHNLFDPHGFPLQPPPPPPPPPPPSDFEMSPRGFAPGPNPNYPYISRSGGWIDD